MFYIAVHVCIYIPVCLYFPLCAIFLNICIVLYMLEISLYAISVSVIFLRDVCFAKYLLCCIPVCVCISQLVCESLKILVCEIFST